jgi:hypothetical protein
VLLITDLADCSCIRIGISVSSCWPHPEIALHDLPMDPRCVIVDISAVLLLDTLKVFANLEDIELQL